MRIQRVIILYLFVIITLTIKYPTVSFSYPPANEAITQYIINLSKEIYSSIQEPDESLVYKSRGEVKLRLLLSPWGELKDAYVSESSGNSELDEISLKAVWMRKRYQPFPEELGDNARWIVVPIIFEVKDKGDTEGRLVKEDNAKKDIDKLNDPLGSFSDYFSPRGHPEARRAEGSHVILRRSAPQDEQSTYRKNSPTAQLNIGEAVDIALENHISAKIAEKEVELSKLKIREARRALYPAASLDYLETIGRTTASTQDFTDKEYKVKFEYPLYYGWRLRYAVDKAISNLKASSYNYDKVLQDLRVEVEVAFYSYLTNKINVDLQRSLLKEVEDIFDIAKKRFDLELSTKAEFLQVQSQLKQIAYQVTSSENDMDMARLILTQAMNIENPEEVKDIIDIDDVNIMELGPNVESIDISLKECMDSAFRNRPDLKAKEYMVDFNDYERKIVESKNQIKVDLAGTYGKSGGAYETETLNMGDSWYLGIKLSKPLGGNTLSTSYTKDKTTEKHGLTSRTESIGKSVEFGILDNLQSFSEKKSSEIVLKKAEEELRETKDAILKEVKESYLNYKKGLIQVKANFNKIKYREEEIRIAKARAELNEIPFSELIQAHISLCDERSFYIESVGSLYQSLAKLNKATGYVLFLDDEDFMLVKAGK